MLGLWGMRTTPLFPSLSGPLWPGMVAPDMGPIYGLNKNHASFTILILAFKLRIYVKLNCLK